MSRISSVVLLGGAAALAMTLAAVAVTRAATEPGTASPPPASATVPTDKCLKCHKGKPVDPVAFGLNSHGSMACTDCHGEVTSSHQSKDVTLATPACSDCHDQPSTGKSSVHIEVKDGGVVDPASCLGCHDDIHNHPRAVACESCHPDVAVDLQGSEHWKPGPDGEEHQAGCKDCHADIHTMLPSSDLTSSLNRLNVHEVCANCHADPLKPANNPITGDTFVPVPSYLSSIHGSKLGKVPGVASCTDCHGHHGFRRILDPGGTLNRAHIIETCGKCHQGVLDRFEKGVHGHELAQETAKIAGMSEEQYAAFIAEVPYQSRPPVCTSCHTSHSISATKNMGDFDEVKALCGKCHEQEVAQLGASVHKAIVDPQTGEKRSVRCQDCHLDYHENRDIRTNDSVMNKRNLAEVCAKCHDEPVTVEETGDTFLPVPSYRDSIHGQGVYDSGLYFSAGCVDCHGSHSVFPLGDPRSSLHHDNTADTCGSASCHVGIHDKFLQGTHGKVFLEEKNAYEALTTTEREGHVFKGPVCTSCHVSHQIKRTDDDGFYKEAILQCGKCHEFAMATYKRSNHGKYALLGSKDVAKCYDCHGDHVNLTAAGPDAELTPEVLLERCRKCHKRASKEMVSYITHLSLSKGMTANELGSGDQLGLEKRKGQAVLRVVRVSMETLLVSVFVFFWLHSLMWLVRGLAERLSRREAPPLDKRTRYFWRLDPAHRVLHVFVVVSFLGLALTGLPIKYPDHAWSAAIFSALDAVFQGNGGQVARILHRVFAFITFGYLAAHIVALAGGALARHHFEIMGMLPRCPVDSQLVPEARGARWYARWIMWAIPIAAGYVPVGVIVLARRFAADRIPGGKLLRTAVEKLFGPDSMVFRWKDAKDLLASFRWFLWLGPRPSWDRWTYYEKFDYMAVFWGVTVIGLSGLCIWFKEFFTSTLGLPGWAINVAMEVHSHEALLATAFIFSIHFFNTHLNPGKFPMDKVIFTGRIDLHELEHERPAWFERLEREGRLEALSAGRAPTWVRVVGTAFGAVAVIIGVTLVVWIVRMEWANLFNAL